MKTLVFVYFMLFYAFCVSQNKIDSLKIELEKEITKSEKYIDILNDLGYSYWIINSKSSLEYGQEALKFLDRLHYLKRNAKAHRVIGVAYWTRGNHLEAIKHLDQALKENKRLDNKEDVVNTTLNLTMVYTSLNEDAKALKMYHDAINQFTALNLKSRIATTFTKIGSLYIHQNRLEQAKEYLDNALKMHIEANFTYGIAEVHNRLGILYIKLKEKEQAYYHIQQAILDSRKVSDTDGMTSNLIQFGKLLLLDREFETAEQHLQLAIESFAKLSFLIFKIDCPTRLISFTDVSYFNLSPICVAINLFELYT